MSGGFEPGWWEKESLFTEAQLQEILKPLKLIDIQTKCRILLERIARRHGELRSQPRFGRSEVRKRLERICKLSARLRGEIFGPLDHFLDVELADAHFHDETGWGSREKFFLPYFQSLERLEQKASELAKFLKGRAEKPPNVDEVRNSTFERLAWFYEHLTDGDATVAVGTDSGRLPGKAYGDFVEFVQAFMGAIPHEKVPTGDQIKWFIDQRRKKRMVSKRPKKL